MLAMALQCLIGTACGLGPAAPDPRLQIAERVLSPRWREGTTWSLEVHGSFGMDKRTVSFWGVSHFVVESVSVRRATVVGRFHPVVFRSPDEPSCSSRLYFERDPWRLVAVELDDAGGGRLPTSDDGDTRAAVSPCLPAIPRHPLAGIGAVSTQRRPQRIDLDADGLTFTQYLGREEGDPLTGVTRWRPGLPWWSKHETMDGERRSVFGRWAKDRYLPGRRRDRLFVERARLIAVDGGVIAAAPWSVPAPESRFRWYSHWPEDSSGLPPDGLFELAAKPTRRP